MGKVRLRQELRSQRCTRQQASSRIKIPDSLPQGFRCRQVGGEKAGDDIRVIGVSSQNIGFVNNGALITKWLDWVKVIERIHE